MQINLKKLKQEKSIQELLEFSIINIDKPSGPTSFTVSDMIRRKLKDAGYNIRKTSHFGTLDPKVTGVLPIAINRGCKLTGLFLGHDKKYIGIMRVHKEGLKINEIQKIINENFVGKIQQIPPLKSRVKRQKREREIKKFNLLEKDEKNEEDFLFEVECQAGTYIRKLIDDLGKKIGGAHMLELRRIKAGIFNENNEDYPSINLYGFIEVLNDKTGRKLKKILMPAEIISEIYPVVKIKKKVKNKLLTGKPIHKEDIINNIKVKKNDIISVFCCNQFIEIAKVINSGEIFAKPLFVLQPIA